MAAFSSSSSFQHQLLDSSSAFLPNSINFDQPNNVLPQFYQQNLDHATALRSINEASVFSATNKTSMDSSSVVTDYKYHDNSEEQLVRKPVSMEAKTRRSKQSSNPNSAQSKDMRGKKQKREKDSVEKKDGKEAPTGYVHVRARRGQATDSHSLAERVRREKISERMKLLQALVPGCEKVTGKALMLDEIINYVQSLQNQVEFLSMKLASVNPMLYDFGMDLESLMVRPEQSFSSLPSPFPVSMQECSPTAAHTYPVLDNTANSLLLQQSQFPNHFPEGDREALWGMDDQRQKIINNSSLFSFPLM